jgi:hypothetical protein
VGEASSSVKNGEEAEESRGLCSESEVRVCWSTFSTSKVLRFEGYEEDGGERCERVRDCIWASLRMPVLEEAFEYRSCDDVGELSSWSNSP